LAGVGSKEVQCQSVLKEAGKTYDLKALKPSQLVRLINSGPAGLVLHERQLFRHRRRAGSAIGNGGRVNLFRYVAWLCRQRHETESDTSPIPHRQFREQARRRNYQDPTGAVSTENILTLLARQKYRCALTGRVLTPKSCSLDHILAVSRGGEHSMRNAQVLDKTVNQAKGTLTNDEFVQLCREVVAHADSRASDHQ
jgi:5-methylcytosine-specific restriction endonuclease McrA